MGVNAKDGAKMSRDKQIEEMAETILYQGDNYDTCCKDDCETIASLIYNAGYRKASEVAREIFEELEAIKVVGISPSGWVKQFAELKN